MLRSICFLSVLTLAACADAPQQTPTAQAVSKNVHSWVMNRVSDYKLQVRSKALAICVKWPEAPSDPILVRTLGGSWTADQSDRNFTPGELMRNAMRQCDGRRAEGNLDCTCQPTDASGSNKLVVPESVRSTGHRIATRPGKA